MKEERVAVMNRRKNKRKREIIEDEEDLDPVNYEGDAKQKITEINRIINNEVISFNPLDARNLKETKLSECPNSLKRLRLEFDDEYIPESVPRDDSQFVDDILKQKTQLVNVTNQIDEDFNRILQGNFFLDIDNAPNKTFIGKFQIIIEKRMIYMSIRRFYFKIHTLYPFIKISPSSFYEKTQLLIEPQSRTGLCDICHEADILFLHIQRYNTTFEEFNSEQQQILFNYKVHIACADHQHDQYKSQIQKLKQGECTFLIDYKENFTLIDSIEQTSRQFYGQRPVTCLTSSSYKINIDRILEQKIITILSPIISYTGTFSLKCVERMMQSDFFQDIDFCHWWSDGGPYFRNQQVVCTLLRDDTPLVPGTEFDINFSEPAHGKCAIDQIFGQYQRDIQDNMPKEGIKSIVSLQEILQQNSMINQLQSESHLSSHEVLIYDIDTFDDYYDTVVIPSFKKFLLFHKDDNCIVAQHLTIDPSANEQKTEIEIIEKECNSTPKRSTVPIDKEDAFQKK